MLDFMDDLLELNQHASAVLRVQEDDRVTVSTNLGLRVDGRDVVLLNLSQSVLDVIYLQADVMHSSTGILGNELRDRAVLSERLQKLNVGVSYEHENGGDTMIGQFLRCMKALVFLSFIFRFFWV